MEQITTMETTLVIGIGIGIIFGWTLSCLVNLLQGIVEMIENKTKTTPTQGRKED